MLSIPDGLHDDLDRPMVESDGVWVVDYAATTPSLSLPVLVTRPTFVLVHAGVKELVSSGSVLTAGAGSLVAMRSGTHVMSDLLPGIGQYTSTIISVDRDVLGQMLPAPSSNQVAVRAVVSEADDVLLTLAQGLRKRVEHSASKTERQLATKQVLASVLMDETVRWLISRDVKEWSSSHAGRVRSIMSAHCFSPLRLDQYASMCAMSVSTFKRAFAETYDASPGQWLIETRLQRAAELLRTTERSVTDIGMDAGFGDLSNFTRAFSRRFEVPPTTFRHQSMQQR